MNIKKACLLGSIAGLVVLLPLFRQTGTAQYTPTATVVTNPNTITNLTASRVYGTIYQNTGSTPLYVEVCGHSGAADQLGAYVKASSPPDVNVALANVPTNTTNGTVFFIVLPGHYYKVDFFGSSKVIIGWFEWT